MKSRALLGCSLSLLALSACSIYRNVPAGEVTAAEVSEGGRWSAALSPPPALAGTLPISGWAAMVRDASGLATLVTLSLADAAPGAVHRWSVNRGRCGADEGVFGPAGVYQPIRIDSSGRATASARVPLRLPTAGDYFVNVRVPSAGGEATVACGNLAPPST
jgi:hypothetical protein